MNDNTTAPKEEIELDKAQIETLRRQTALLECYEGKIQGLLQDRLDGHVSDDDYSEQHDELRRVFLKDFQNLYSEIDEDTPEIFYRKVVYRAAMNQVKRYFAYYNAISDISVKIAQYNMELGDQVLDFNTDEQLHTIRKLEQVKMVTAMVEALEFPPDHSARIINHTIDNLFASKSQGIKLPAQKPL